MTFAWNNHSWSWETLALQLFEGATEPLRPDAPHPQIPITPTRFWPPFWPEFDLNLTQFWPQIAPRGQNRVKFRSKSGQKGGQNRVGVSGSGSGSCDTSNTEATSERSSKNFWKTKEVYSEREKLDLVLPFLAFLGKRLENLKKKPGFVIPTEPLTSLEKKDTCTKNKQARDARWGPERSGRGS